jgi:hypothetical protein
VHKEFRLRHDRQMVLPRLLRFGALAKHPFANIRRGLDDFDALILATDQKTDHPDVYQGDLAQIQNFACAAFTQSGANAGDQVRLKSADQAQFRLSSVAVFLHPEHFVLIPRSEDSDQSWFCLNARRIYYVPHFCLRLNLHSKRHS